MSTKNTKSPIFSLSDIDFSVKDMLLLAGGLFLIAKSTLEMHVDISGNEVARIINNTFLNVE